MGNPTFFTTGHKFFRMTSILICCMTIVVVFISTIRFFPNDEHPYLLYDYRSSIYLDYQVLGVPGIVLQIRSSPELRRSGFAGVHKFRIVTQYRSPSNP